MSCWWRNAVATESGRVRCGTCLCSRGFNGQAFNRQASTGRLPQAIEAHRATHAWPRRDRRPRPYSTGDRTLRVDRLHHPRLTLAPLAPVPSTPTTHPHPRPRRQRTENGIQSPRDQSYETGTAATTNRNPRKSRLSGRSLSRATARAFPGVPFQEPPRNTRGTLGAASAFSRPSACWYG